MFLTNLKITLRNLYKRRLYSMINIAGLSLGLTAAAIVILYSRYERSYDDFHTLSDRTYRVSGQNQETGTWFAALAASYSDAIYKKSLPEVEASARVRRWTPRFIQYDDKKFYEEKLLITDPSSDFFTLFNFPFEAGDARNALKEPYSAVLTASIAKKIFGDSNPIGKTILHDTLPLTVTGVIKDLPGNTHFDFKVLTTNPGLMKEASAMFTYCVLQKNTDIAALKKKILQFPKPENKHAILGNVAVTPLSKLHFESTLTYEMKSAGSKLYLLLFNLVGLLIVLLSCTNYMNLSIAMYAERRKEIAVRKVVGAGNARLAFQFLSEAICISLICLPITWALLELTLPWFNQFMGLELQNEFITSLSGFAILLGVTLVMGIISGSYPAWVLPKLKAITLFHKINIASRSGLSLRRVLVTFQISILVMIVSGSWIIHNQMGYLQHKDLGFAKEGVLKLTGASWVDSAQYYTLKNELLQNPHIKSVSQGYAPGNEEYGYPFKAPGSEIIHNDLIAFGTDYDYTATLGLEILQSDFTDINKEKPRRLILVNETTAALLGYKDPVGKKVVLFPGKQGERTYTINGVVKDFHFFSLHRPVAPMFFNTRSFGSGISENILVKVQMDDLANTMDFIQKTTRKVIPHIPLAPQFMDETLDKLYAREQKLASISQVLLLITLFLSISGLVGLAAYMAQLRTKEMGIRKILGASVARILQLLSYSFVKMALVAVVIGSCISWILMNQWLKNFAYKTPISWMVFAGTALTLLAIIIITICGHTLKTALANPVKSLRTE